jgi:hypothetical protein
MFFYSTLKFVACAIVVGFIITGTVGFGTLDWLLTHALGVYGVFMGLVGLMCASAILHERPPHWPRRQPPAEPVERDAFGEPI